MKVNFDFKIKNTTGEILQLRDVRGELIDAKTPELIAECLMSDGFKENTKVKKYLLACRVEQEVEFELDEDDFALIKKAVDCPNCGIMNKATAPISLELGRIEKLHAGDEKPVKKEK